MDLIKEGKQKIKELEGKSMKSRLKTMIAILLTVCFLASGCTTKPKSSQNSSTNSTNKTATEATESSSEKNSEDSENVPSEPLTIETPAGVVLVGKIKKDAKGWYFESERPLNVKLTCYTDITPSYNNLTRIGMFDNSEDGTNKELYRDDTVTVAGMLQNFRGDMESLYFYPCKIEHGKTVKTGYAVPELDYPSAEPADYDPTAPLPSEMQPVVKNGHFEYNPYILTKNTLECMGNDFAVFYKDFVDAWLSYKTSCPCKDKNYAEMFLSVMYYEFPLFTADGEYDFQNGYDEDTKTLSWSYKSKSKAEHDKLISDFTMAANSFLKQVKASDSEQLRAQAVYHAFCTSMTYDYEIMTTRERIDAYYAYTLRRGICVTFACAMAQLFAQVGVNATVASGETTSGGHVWNVVTINGNNYFCDSTFELSFNSGNGFVYFGMTLKDRLNDGSGFSESNMMVGSMNIKSVSEMALSEKTLQIK